MTHGLLLSTLEYIFCFQKTFTRSRPLDYLSAYPGFCNGDKWIYVLLMRSSGRLTQLQITASVRGRGITD